MTSNTYKTIDRVTGEVIERELTPEQKAARHAQFAGAARKLMHQLQTEAANRESVRKVQAEQRRKATDERKAEIEAQEDGVSPPGPTQPAIVLPKPKPLVPAGGVFVPTQYQHDVMMVPEVYSLILAGGRGTGKSVGGQQVVLRHCALWGEHAKVLVIRQHLRSLAETETEIQLALAQAYPKDVRFDRQNHVARLPNQATIEFACLADAMDYSKLQGRNFSLIVVEEAGLFNQRQWKWLRMLFSNLRAPGNVPTRVVLLANPGGPGHNQIHALIRGQSPWHPFGKDGLIWVWCHAAGRASNPHLDWDSYEARLAAACGHDSALLAAWKDGSWDIGAVGSFFGDVLDSTKQMFKGDGPFKLPHDDLQTYLAGDWGQSSPAVMMGCIRLRREHRGYPKGSLILFDEVSSVDRTDESWSSGLNWSPSRFGDAVADRLCDGRGIARTGVVDDSKGLTESLIEILKKPPISLHLKPPDKKRRDGWAALRDLMFASKAGNGRAGLWVSDRCEGFWQTIDQVPRSELNPEDVDTGSCDHWADAARYAATYRPSEMTFGRAVGI